MTGRLVVRVTDRDSHPIPGARVSVTGARGSVLASATTAEDGTAAFPTLRAGAYSVAARAVGARAPRRTNVRIMGGAETSLYLMLEPAAVDTIRVRGRSPG